MKSRQDFQTDQEWIEYLRRYYAGMAMQGMAASEYWSRHFTKVETYLPSMAEVAVMAADALIAELNKPQP